MSTYLLKPLSKTANRSHVVVLTTDRYSKLVRATPNNEKMATQNMTMFLDHCVVMCGVPGHLIAES